MRKNIMKKQNLWLLCVLLVCLFAFFGCKADSDVVKMPTDETYEYIKPDVTKADVDEGIVLDGILDEAVYQDKNWLYLSNYENGADVDIAMTSHYGEKGIYILYDVSEGNPIYVNLNRGSTLNSSIEMYLSLGSFETNRHSGFFEIDLMPTGDMAFKQANGKGTYTNVATTRDIMAVLGATTKGGEVNTPECNGYCLELFIPWDYLDWLGLDSNALRESAMYINPAHITSFNYAGTSNSVDRYWYQFVEKKGGSFGAVFTYFQFDGNGVRETFPVSYEADGCTVSGPKAVIPGMENTFVFTPDAGSSLTSIVIDGEEYIHLADQAEDGSVTIQARCLMEGMKVSAKAEAVTSGNKKLTGKVLVEDGDLEGLSISYIGPKGELPVEVDNEGGFVLEDLVQGYYSVVVEKEGYSRLKRSVLLNRDMTLELTLEKPVFEITSGNAWLTDGEREGSVHKMAGSGIILSEESYNRFTFEAKFRYDAALAEQSDHDYFTQQRQGMRIAFNNGMNWRIDLVRENDIFHVQYAGAGETTLFKWKSAYKLTQAEIKKYCSEEGITLRVERDGRYANVYLDNKLVAVEQFDSVYAGCTARVGFEAWTANEGVWEYPYVIKDSVNKYLPGTLFDTAKGWDVTGQYAGYITIPAGGTNKIPFINKYGDFDLTLHVQDHPESTDKEGTYPRNDVLLNFDNGTNVSFGIACHNGKAIVQCLNQGDDTSKHIYKKYKWWYDLTAEEQALYENGGVDFRLVRIGTEVSLYINGKMIGVADLTSNKSGVTATAPAKLTIRHYDDAGVWIKLPVKMTTKLDTVTIHTPEGELGKVVTQKQSYVIGDTVVLSGEGKDGYYCTGMTVNGTLVELNWDGTYTYTATEKEYTVEGSFAEKVFNDNANWNLVKQNQGVVALPNGGNGGRLEFCEKYTDMDLTVKVQDYAAGQVDPRNDVLLMFDNGAVLSVGIATNNGQAIIQSLNYGDDTSKHIYKKYQWWHDLTAEEQALYENGGVELRLVRSGTSLVIFLNDKYIATADLANNNSGVTAATPASVQLRHYDDTGVEVVIPFEITDSVEKVTVSCVESALGTVTANQSTYVLGQAVTVTATPNSGYFCTGMTINGKTVAVDAKGTYTFIAEKSSYEISADFAKKVFVDHGSWNLTQQHTGVIVPKPADGNYTGYLQTVDSYNGFTLTFKEPAGAPKGFAVGGQFYFSNDKFLVIKLEKTASGYQIRSASGNKNCLFQEQIYCTLTADQVSKLQNTGITLKAVRTGTIVRLYLDDVQLTNLNVEIGGTKQTVEFFDLTKDSKNADTGITGNTTAIVKFAKWGKVSQQPEISYTLTPYTGAPAVALNCNAGTGGSITADKTAYYVGDTVKLTFAAESEYLLTGVTVNGKAVTLTDGTYSFVASEESYNVQATFVEKIFKDNTAMDLTRQHEGIILITKPRASDGYSWYVEAKASYNGFTLNVKEPADAGNDFAVGGQLYFSNKQYIMFQLDKTASGYQLRSASGGALFAEQVHYTLTDAQVSKIKDTGITLKVVRTGTIVKVYLDDIQITDLKVTINGEQQTVSYFDLKKNHKGADTGIDINTTAVVKFAKWGKVTNPTELRFTLLPYENAKPVVLNCNAGDGGTITTDKAAYYPGDTVTLTVAGDAGYAHNSLTVNGQPVMTDLYGKYSFVITEDTAVNASFASSVFKSAVSGWLLENQHYGQIAANKSSGHSAWADLAGEYGDIDITLTTKEFENTNALARTLVRFMFTNGKVMSISVAKNSIGGGNYKYTVQSTGGNNLEASGYDYYTLNADQIAKFTGEGIQFRVVRSGTQVCVYLDDVMVVDGYDLTKGGTTGITADTKMTVTIRQYDTPNTVAVFDDFRVSAEVSKVMVKIAESANGQVTTDQSSYQPGQKVVLTVKPDSGYYCTGLYVDGTAVDVNWDGTYSFVASKERYEVSCGFGTSLFTGGDIRHWNLSKHRVGELKVNSHASGHSGYIDYVGTCNDVTMVVKDYTPDAKNYNMQYRFTFSNGETFYLRINHEDADGVYRIQSIKSGNTLSPNWSNKHDFTAEETAAITGDGIEFRVIILNNAAHVYLDGAKVCTFDFVKDIGDATATVTLRMNGNLNYDVYMPYELKNTTQLP